MEDKVILVNAYENGLAYFESNGTSYVRNEACSPLRIRESTHEDFHPMFTRLTKPNIFLRGGLEFKDFDEADNVLEASSLMCYFVREALRGNVSEEGNLRFIRKFQGLINSMDLSYFTGITRFEELKPALQLEPEDVVSFLRKLTQS